MDDNDNKAPANGETDDKSRLAELMATHFGCAPGIHPENYKITATVKEIIDFLSVYNLGK